MTELRNIEVELDRFRARTIAAAAFVLLCFGVLVFRWFVLQVVRHDDLQAQAEANRIGVVPIVPNRGLIVDRNGIVMATNYPAYTLEITPSKVADLEATINEIAKVIEVTPRDRKRFARLAAEGKSFESVPIRTKLTDEEVARFVAQRFRFPGVEIKARLFRNYPHGELASHLVGYIGRINQEEKQKIVDDWSDEDQANYRGTEYIGKLGLEQSYESELHGTTGFEQIETSAGGRAVRQLASKPATPGNTLQLSIDIRLQALVEELYGDRRGALVAIDPRNGEVLAFVSKPTFDPNLFVDGIDSDNWKELNESHRQAAAQPRDPRHLRAGLHLQALHGAGRADAGQAHGRSGACRIRATTPSAATCSTTTSREGHGFVDMYQSIVKSCDIYYFALANDMGVDNIAAFMQPFGFGQPTGIDLQGELRGVLPSTEWKRKAYRRAEQQRWYAGETISLGIGQGYNNYTIMQLANALATLSTGGQRHTPHLVRDVVDVVSGVRHPVAPDAAAAAHAQSRLRRGDPQRDGGRQQGRHRRRGLPQRRLRLRRQDRHRAGGGHQGQREVQRGQGRRVPARQRAVHRLRAGRPADDRDRHGGRERRLRRAVRGADRAPRDGLLDQGHLPDRRGHRRRQAGTAGAAEDGRPADRAGHQHPPGHQPFAARRRLDRHAASPGPTTSPARPARSRRCSRPAARARRRPPNVPRRRPAPRVRARAAAAAAARPTRATAPSRCRPRARRPRPGASRSQWTPTPKPEKRTP